MNVTSARSEPLTLAPIARASVAQSVAEQLLREIREKQLAPGTRLPSERELMNALGVGRSSIREAVNGLGMLGVVEVRQGQGAFVTEAAAGFAPSRSIAVALARGATHELFEARRLVEVDTARMAAGRRTSTDLAAIARALEDHRKALRAGSSGVEPSVRFHVEVAEAAHNEILAGVVASFAEMLGRRGPVLEQIDGFREWEIEQHESVYLPIEAGDPEAAANQMRAHLDAVVHHHEAIGIE